MFSLVTVLTSWICIPQIPREAYSMDTKNTQNSEACNIPANAAKLSAMLVPGGLRVEHGRTVDLISQHSLGSKKKSDSEAPIPRNHFIRHCPFFLVDNSCIYQSEQFESQPVEEDTRRQRPTSAWLRSLVSFPHL